MSRGKIIKAIGLIIVIVLMILGLSSLYKFIFSGRQTITTKTSSSVYAGSNLEAIVKVEKNGEDIKSKVSAQLYDSNNKKVRDAKYTCTVNEGEDANISIKIPDNLEKGPYTLKVNARNGLYTDTSETKINVSPTAQSKAIISMDKGIYKPGDEINYRALIVSKRDNTPVKTDVSVSIYDGNDNKVYSEKTEASDYGIISGKFKLADEVNSGTYKLCVDVGGYETTEMFNVNPYITPKFEVSLLTDKENYLFGEKIELTVACKYFFGEPVANASVEGTINGEEVKGITDSEGNFKYEYPLSKIGNINLDFKVVDSSNYMIEESKTVSCGTNKFEIEILPEFGGLTTSFDNDIYVFTKAATGEPVKTYSTIKIDTFTKQIISDENGIGKVTFTKNELETLSKKIPSSITVEAKDMDGNIVKSDVSVNFIENATVIKTDRVKYNAGEDISVKVASKYDIGNTVFIKKGNELLKTISTDDEEITFNLENTTGLVDIYARNSSYNYSKRTIFIMPDQALNVNIKLAREEYKPGDNLNAEIYAKDENNNSVDAALLVSILDEAILNLADNDLNIDNVKLALEDIELSDGITAADVYASAMGEASDTILMTALLKQSIKSPDIIENRTYSYPDELDLFKAIVYLGIAVLIVLTYVAYKSEKFRALMKKVIVPIFNVLAIFIFLMVVADNTDILYDLFNGNALLALGSILVISIIAYALILYKFSKYIFKISYELIIPCIVVFLVEAIVMEVFYDVEYLNLFLVLGLLIIFTILTVINRKKKLTGILKAIYGFIINIFKFIVFAFVLYLLVETTNAVIIPLVLSLAGYFTFDIITSNQKDKDNEKKIINNGKIVLNVTPLEIIGMMFGIGFILIVFLGLGLYIYNSASATVTDSITGMVIEDYDDDFYYRGTTSHSFADMDMAKDTTSASESIPGVFDVFNSSKSSNSEDTIAMEVVEQALENETTTSSETQVTKVRNIFLESLAFIPELIAENGKANLSVPISDNITTWSIQTIGNTKNGNIGYASASFKVFQEYFIDFSLPTNSVVGDKVSIPVTVHNYTENDLSVNLKVKENDAYIVENYQNELSVPANNTKMVYVPIELVKEGNVLFRVESSANGKSDIVEKTLNIKLNGFEIEKVVSSGIITDNYSMDILFDEEYIAGSEKLKLKLYPSAIVQTVENIEGILRLPTGCFEQTSSSLYPDILVLKYLEDSGTSNPELKEKALEYISQGYQKLLTYEVPGTTGGYSLYGNAPAEPVITAFGLMEFNELKDVYDVEDRVIDNMTNYLFTNQNLDGTFNYSSTYIGGANATDKVAMTAYIAWAISEVDPEDERLEKTVDYLEKHIETSEDTYTLALIANVLVNTNRDTSKVFKILKEKVIPATNGLYVDSRITDYYGTRGRYQNIQATALTSIAFSKANKENKNNGELINYIISCKAPSSTWGTTQATILALKAINEFSSNSDISKQTLTINLNNKSNSIDIKDDALDVYELEFDNVSKENKLSIGMKKGKLIYEVIKDYYVEYEKLEENDQVKVESNIIPLANVNDTITQTISVYNNSENEIENGLIRINIPQGTTVIEDSLLELKYKGIIEKYEYNYSYINIYVRNMPSSASISNISVKYRALYPEEITGGAVRFYDYYNPDIEAINGPSKLIVR